MIAKLKKVLYTVDENHPDGEVVLQVSDNGLVEIWSIARFRAARIIYPGKRKLGKMQRAVPASVLRNARRFDDLLAENETAALLMDDQQVEELRALERVRKLAVAIVHVSDLRRVKELYSRLLSAYELYCEFAVNEGSIKCTGELGEVVIPAQLTVRGSIGLNFLYLAEAAKNLIARDAVGIAIVRNGKGVRILMLASEYERHYIAEMRPKK